MATQTSMLHIRIDDKLKEDATAKLENIGLSVSEAVRIFLTRVSKEGGLPVGLTTDAESYDSWFRAKVREAMEDTRPTISHSEVMDDVQAIIDRKRTRA